MSSGKHQSFARFGDRTAQFSSCLDPLGDDNLDVRQRRLIRNSIGRTAGKFRYFGDESLIGLTPVQDDLVTDVIAHRNRPFTTSHRLRQVLHALLDQFGEVKVFGLAVVVEQHSVAEDFSGEMANIFKRHVGATF